MKILNLQNIRTVLIAIALFWATFSNSAISQERISVRSGDHPTYSRVVFDWARNVEYRASLNQDKVIIYFSANAVPDFSSVMMNGPAFFSNPSYQVDGGNLIVTLDTRNIDRIRHFKSGTKVVLDLLADGTDVPVDNIQAEIVSANNQVINANSNNVPAIPPVIRPSVDIEPQIERFSPIETDGTLNIRGQTTSGAFIIDYTWDKDVKAAAFIRSDKLWVVFDQFTAADHSGLSSLLGDRVKTAQQLTDLSPTILNYTIAPNQNARMIKTAQGWQVSLRSNLAVPQLPIQIGHQSNNSTGENIFLIAEDLGTVINIEDPFVGDEITIVTASQSSQGIIEQNNFTEFNILKSAQGIALQLIADDIFVTRHDNGVSVSGQNGLAITRNNVTNLRGAPLVVEAGSEVQENLMLLDFVKWQEGPVSNGSFVKNRHELLYNLATSTESERNEERWNLAIYDLAHNNAAEAFGVLQLMAESEPAFMENPSYRGVLAVANIKMRRFNDAVELLNHKAFVAELDALLWRGLANEALGNHERALSDFSKGVDVLSLQTNDNKAAFLFSSIRTADALGNVEFMSSQINSMSNTALNAKQLTELDYWRGRMAEEIGDEVTAGQEYEKVMATNLRYPAAVSTSARINQQYRLGEIDAAQAIDALEKLRFAWRGDQFELNLLEQLGDLYVELGDYREGLSILRQAATYFPRSPRTRDLTRQMTDIYNQLFLEGGADNLPPLKAMALFLEFRELTPLGADGDTMTRNLARRMVTVDLLKDAAELLEFQVKNRLQGVARADIATDLAMIYLMDKQAEKALQTLRSTRQSQVPDDIEQNRRMIEIRALVELGSYEEAEVMLEGNNGEVANNLRSDIYWKTEDWRRVVNHGFQMLGDRWSDSEELSLLERQSVLRIAVAMALDEDQYGLDQLRSQYLNHMENGTFADAFELITAREQRSGDDIRQLTQTIASVDRLETFMDSYRNEFSVSSGIN